MTRRRLLFAVLLVAGLTAWTAARPATPARAGTDAGEVVPARDAVAADYSGTDEDAAAHRWATGQTRHWRHLMVKR